MKRRFNMMPLLCFFSFFLMLLSVSVAQMPGFLSIDCGGSGNYTDELGLHWTHDDANTAGGLSAVVSPSAVPSETRRQYSTVRYFPASDSDDGRTKHCYTVPVPRTRTRYLLRATFLYGNFDGSKTFPEFDLYVGATRWSTIVIYDEARVVTREMVALALSPALSVCVANATTGQPFISTLELRPLNGSLYYTAYESAFFLSLAARINFGAPTADAVRYPDDPYDRIWESDMVRRANYLVDVAPGTVRLATDRPVFVDSNERPPQKVMQTAVVGSLGELTYRLNLNGFPGSGWAFSYFAEIDDDDVLAGSRRFKLYIPGVAEVSKPTVDVGENAPGRERLYEPGYNNISLPFVLSFAFRKTNDSDKGPILNAFEIYSYVPIVAASPDAPAMAAIAARYHPLLLLDEGGDPCLPSAWSWLKCTQEQDQLPASRVLSINLSGHNLTGSIPPELAALPCLQEIRLDNNMLTGPIPDLSASSNLSIIHFENNQLTGSVPSYLADLPKLTELHLENNRLSGVIPRALLSRSILFKYSGNTHLRSGKQEKQNVIIIISALLGVLSFLLAAALCCYVLMARKTKAALGSKHYSAQGHSVSDDDDGVASKELVQHQVSAEKKKRNNSKNLKVAEEEEEEDKYTIVHVDAAAGHERMMTRRAHPFKLCELEAATNKFAKRIGSGGFGVVYYGKLPADGKEIAVKVPTNGESYQGKKQFANEVSLLSRIHHRNLVAFLGYCCHASPSSSGDGRRSVNMNYMLVYDFMHNGTLKEHLHGRDKHLTWIQRLEVAEDSAKGIEYLHCGCTPSIIHRDIKTSNILLDSQMHAKVADFGLSRFAADDASTTNVRGTLGYLDPHYYVSQQLTEKSDMYSFGIILLELISGRPPISTIALGDHFRNIGPWAKFYYESGDIEAIIDPSLKGEYHDVHSVWKMAETAVRCIDGDPRRRPSMPEVVKDIQEAITLERPKPRAPPPLTFSPAQSGTVRSHDMIMDNLMHDDDSFSDSLNYPGVR